MSENKVKVYYLSLDKFTPHRGYWDYGFIYDLLKDFDYKEVSTLPEENIGIVVIPARSHYRLVEDINHELSKFKGVVLFLMGDEEHVFPVEKIKHPNMKIWVQNPQMGRHDSYRKLGCGYPYTIHDMNLDFIKKDLYWFFSGQVTHSRREECVKELRNLHEGMLLESKGFTQGMPQQEYFANISRSWVCPCPSGPETVDSFRLFESLQLGSIPIADTKTPREDQEGFWEWLFEEPIPFPTISNWESLPGYIIDNLALETLDDVYAWWFRYKNKVKGLLMEDVKNVLELNLAPSETIIIPVSPIPSHPETDILDETLKSVKHHFPNSPIIITFDGVRDEQKDKCEDYYEFIRRFLFKHRDDMNIIPYIFKEHKHQIGMARDIISKVKTPFVVYVEQDTPFVIDEPIEWGKVKELILNGESNLVRFHFEAFIPKEHEHLMVGNVENGFIKTIQWSQRPHMSSTAYYKRILFDYFSDNAKCFIEDKMHSVVQKAYYEDGILGWSQHRLHIYHPDKNIKRSYNLDGRANGKKFDESQVF